MINDLAEHERDGRFCATWLSLMQEGVCDTIGGEEFKRVIWEWRNAGFPDADKFIRERANIDASGKSKDYGRKSNPDDFEQTISARELSILYDCIDVLKRSVSYVDQVATSGRAFPSVPSQDEAINCTLDTIEQVASRMNLMARMLTERYLQNMKRKVGEE